MRPLVLHHTKLTSFIAKDETKGARGVGGGGGGGGEGDRIRTARTLRRLNRGKRQSDSSRKHAQRRRWSRQETRRVEAEVREEVAGDEAASHE